MAEPLTIEVGREYLYDTSPTCCAGFGAWVLAGLSASVMRVWNNPETNVALNGLHWGKFAVSHCPFCGKEIHVVTAWDKGD